MSIQLGHGPGRGFDEQTRYRRHIAIEDQSVSGCGGVSGERGM